jgi:hypothetical protein
VEEPPPPPRVTGVPFSLEGVNPPYLDFADRPPLTAALAVHEG